MASLAELGFNAAAVEPNEGFDVLPAGEYDAAIVKSEVKTTNSGDGRYLKIELQILNGQYQNRKVWDQLNIWNPDAQATQIAKGTLSAICRAVNVLTPNDSSELHDKPMRIKLAVKSDTKYGDKNVVRAYKPRLAGPVVPPAPVPQPVAAGAPAGNPWG